MTSRELRAPALPWTEFVLKRATPLTRLRTQFAWERLPRTRDPRHPRSYVDGLRLPRQLFDGGYTVLYPLRGRELFRLGRHVQPGRRPGRPGRLRDLERRLDRAPVGRGARSRRVGVRLLRGPSRAERARHGEHIGPVALLHCDGDWYDSVRCVLEQVYPLVSPGGWIVIDDYGAVPSAGRATDDFKRGVRDPTPLRGIDQTGYCWRKPGR